jgi:hypothetical protein
MVLIYFNIHDFDLLQSILIIKIKSQLHHKVASISVHSIVSNVVFICIFPRQIPVDTNNHNQKYYNQRYRPLCIRQGKGIYHLSLNVL